MQVFQGHMPFGLHRILPQKASYLTVLRDPVDRGISEYYYALSRVVHPQHRELKQLTLAQYIQATPHANMQTKMLAGNDPGYDFLSGECTDETLKLAKENLATRFSVVGLTDRFDETLALAKIRFGWRIQNYSSFNVTSQRPKKKEVPEEMRSAIAERYSYDMKLYEYANELFSQQLEANRGRMEQELESIAKVKQLSTTQDYYFRGLSAARKVITRMHSYI
jgi:hypothetical protein